MKIRDYFLLFIAGLIVSSLMLLIRPYTGYMDADYYFGTAREIASGHGFIQNFLWNYLDNPASILHPAFTYWMPLSSIIAAIGLWIFQTERTIICKNSFRDNFFIRSCNYSNDDLPDNQFEIFCLGGRPINCFLRLLFEIYFRTRFFWDHNDPGTNDHTAFQYYPSNQKKMGHAIIGGNTMWIDAYVEGRRDFMAVHWSCRFDIFRKKI